MRKTEYLCDRCRKPISYESLKENDFPYILHRRLPISAANPIMEQFAQGPSIDLCENCRKSFKKWLGEDY